MDETEMRFQLLLRELESIQQGIRAMDNAMFAIKGWCVTVDAAIVGVAINKGQPLLLLAGLIATICFWLLDSHFKAVQRIYILRDLDLESKLRVKPFTDVLAADSPIVPGLASLFGGPPMGFWKNFAFEAGLTLREARTPIVFNLYALVTVSLGMVAAVLLLT
jgi:hypothetical protein